MPHKSDSNYHTGMTLSEPVHVSIHTYYTHFSFFLINTLLIHKSLPLWEFFFCKAEEPRPCHWLLVWWLGVTPFTDLNLWPGTEILLPAAVGRGHPRCFHLWAARPNFFPFEMKEFQREAEPNEIRNLWIFSTQSGAWHTECVDKSDSVAVKAQDLMWSFAFNGSFNVIHVMSRSKRIWFWDQ